MSFFFFQKFITYFLCTSVIDNKGALSMDITSHTGYGSSRVHIVVFWEQILKYFKYYVYILISYVLLF